MKKLLHISPNKFPDISSEHHTKNIWRDLAKGFDEYHLFARSKSNKLIKNSENNITVFLIPKIINRSWIFFITCFYVLIYVKKNKITHILCQCPLLGGVIAIAAKKIYKLPVMIEIHGDVYFNYMQRDKLINFIPGVLVRYVFKNATKIRSLSSSMTQELKKFGISNNIIEIPNRVNLNIFNSPKCSFELNEDIKLISVGRFVPQKGYDLAIKAISELSNRYKISLILIGGGEEEIEYKKLMQNLKINNVVMIDWIPQKDLVEIIKSSDIYIQPSKKYLGEAMPRTILEAMAIRMPIIATDVCAIPGIIVNKYNGILIKENSLNELIDAIVKLVEDKNMRKNIAYQAYADVNLKYEWNSVFEKYRNELINMCSVE